MVARASMSPTSKPATASVPALGSSSPAAMRNRVDLPEPLWPMSATDSPTPTTRSKGCRATTPS